MDRTRLHLDNPAFADRLRQPSRSLPYVSRPTPAPAKAFSDITVLSSPQRVVPKPVLEQQAKEAVRIIQDFVVTQRIQPAKSSAAPTAKPHHQPQKSIVLNRQAAIHQQRLLAAQIGTNTPEADPPARKHKRPVLLYAMAGLIFVIGVAVSLNGFRANRQVAAQVQQLANKSNSSSDDSGSTPSTKKPSNNDVANYYVAPNLPRYVDIAKLSVHARVISMGVTSKNQLKAPGNVYDAGWYNASAQPGQPGAMLLDGHISSWTTRGVFYGLNKLKAGDPIVITRGDGKKFTYTVVKSELDDANKVDMASLLVSRDTAKPGLNLISCSGDVIPGTNEFDKRIVVYAVMQ